MAIESKAVELGYGYKAVSNKAITANGIYMPHLDDGTGTAWCVLDPTGKALEDETRHPYQYSALDAARADAALHYRVTGVTIGHQDPPTRAQLVHRVEALEEALSLALQHVPITGDDAARIYDLEKESYIRETPGRSVYWHCNTYIDGKGCPNPPEVVVRVAGWREMLMCRHCFEMGLKGAFTCGSVELIREFTAKKPEAIT